MASRRKRKKQKVKETAPADPAEELRRKERANAVLLRDNFKGQLRSGLVLWAPPAQAGDAGAPLSGVGGWEKVQVVAFSYNRFVETGNQYEYLIEYVWSPDPNHYVRGQHQRVQEKWDEKDFKDCLVVQYEGAMNATPAAAQVCPSAATGAGAGSVRGAAAVGETVGESDNDDDDGVDDGVEGDDEDEEDGENEENEEEEEEEEEEDGEEEGYEYAEEEEDDEEDA